MVIEWNGSRNIRNNGDITIDNIERDTRGRQENFLLNGEELAPAFGLIGT